MSKNIVRFVFFISFMLLFFFSTLHLFLIFYKQTISENVLLVMILFFTFIHYNFGMFVKKEFVHCFGLFYSQIVTLPMFLCERCKLDISDNILYFIILSSLVGWGLGYAVKKSMSYQPD